MTDQAIQNISPMEIALQEFKAWLEAEGINLIVDQDNKITTSLNDSTNIQNATTNNQEESNQYQLGIDIAKRLERATSIAQAFSADMLPGNTVSDRADNFIDPNVIDVNKKFSELIKEGPKTAAEQKLIEAVDTLLSHQDKTKAINSDLTVGEVITKVNASIKALQEAIQAMMQDKKEEKNTQHQEQKMSLGEPLPGLDQLLRNIIKGLEAAQDKSKESKENKSTDKINSLAKPNSGLDNIKPQDTLSKTITCQSVTADAIGHSNTIPSSPNPRQSPYSGHRIR